MRPKVEEVLMKAEKNILLEYLDITKICQYLEQVIIFSDIKLYSLRDSAIFAAFFLLQHHLIDLTN